MGFFSKLFGKKQVPNYVIITQSYMILTIMLLSTGLAIADSEVRNTVDAASQIGSGVIGILFILFILVFFLRKSRKKVTDDEFRKFMTKLQPGKNDLLINNQWGIPLSNIEKEEAGNKNLVKWNHRWVTKEELRTLKRQYGTYRRIKGIGIIIYIIGIYALIRAGEKFQSFPSDTAETVVVLSLFLYPVFHFVVGYGLQKYKNWARWVAVILFPLLIPPRTFYAYQTDEIFQWYLIVTIFFIFILVTVFSKSGKVIFTSGRVPRSENNS